MVDQLLDENGANVFKFDLSPSVYTDNLQANVDLDDIPGDITPEAYDILTVHETITLQGSMEATTRVAAGDGGNLYQKWSDLRALRLVDTGKRYKLIINLPNGDGTTTAVTFGNNNDFVAIMGIDFPVWTANKLDYRITLAVVQDVIEA